MITSSFLMNVTKPTLETPKGLNMTPKLLIGMAVFDDFDGVYFTVQALRTYHAEAMREVEIAVIDNNSGSASGKATRELMGWVKGDVAAAHYIPFTGATGTAAPRDHLFQVGAAPVVTCVDPHVLLVPGSIRRLIDFFDHHWARDLYHGPMLYDDGKNFSTHFEDKWGNDQMWGEWGTDRRATNADAEPFEIPAQGLGLFACRRDAWLGFNPRFRGFGGEEWYIHEKFRRAGRKVWCLPFLRWLHRFGRPNGVRYRLDIWDKARNYVLGLTELGLSLDRARAAFVDSGKIKEEDWNRLVQNPEYRPQAPGCTAFDNRTAQPAAKTLDELYDAVKKTPRDLDQHADYVRELASSSPRVTAFVKRREWNVILAAARPQSLVVYQKEDDPLLKAVHEAIKAEQTSSGRTYATTVGGGADSLAVDIEPTDLLVIDTVHSSERLGAELQRHAGKVSERILVRGTGAFGEQAEGSNDPGLLHAVRSFVKERPEWTVTHHTSEQYGLTVLSRNPADKKPLPSLWQQSVNAAKASWRAGANVLRGFGPLKDTEAHDRRLALCLICPSHNSGRCAACGCPIDKKTSWPTEQCPLGKWSQEDASELPVPDVQSSAESSTPAQ